MSAPYLPLARRPPARRRAPHFATSLSAAALEALDAFVDEVVATELSFLALVRRHPNPDGGLFSKAQLLDRLRVRDLATPERIRRLRKKPVRAQSGIVPVTVLTRPHPCPGRCVFCPNDVRMPKSYLSDEPGAQRAEDNRFDPYLQCWNRLLALHRIGQPTDKVELLVLGGTFTAYPAAYRRWFVAGCLDALSDFAAGVDARRSRPQGPSLDALPRAPGVALAPGQYNDRVRILNRAARSEYASWSELEAAQARNASAGSRCVGLVFETRPDEISPTTVREMRRLGATKVQLGMQSLRDEVLASNKRDHTLAQAREACAELRRAGFKLLLHWMPNLLGATAAADLEDARRLFEDPGLRPDELKVYPCSLVETAELMRHYEDGSWRPYDDATLEQIFVEVLRWAPAYCRIARMFRDIPAGDIVAGSHAANLRESAARAAQAQGIVAREIRSRELRAAPMSALEPRLDHQVYLTNTGEEHFLQWLDVAGKLLGFARLSLPQKPGVWPELRRAALLRELHVYGEALPLAAEAGHGAQHRGLGRALVREAAETAQAAGYEALAVISAVGTRAYYAKLGFEPAGLYQRLELPSQIDL